MSVCWPRGLKIGRLSLVHSCARPNRPLRLIQFPSRGKLRVLQEATIVAPAAAAAAAPTAAPPEWQLLPGANCPACKSTILPDRGCTPRCAHAGLRKHYGKPTPAALLRSAAAGLFDIVRVLQRRFRRRTPSCSRGTKWLQLRRPGCSGNWTARRWSGRLQGCRARITQKPGGTAMLITV